MIRHPLNSNLTLFYGDHFHGLPVMVGKGPFIAEYLECLKGVIDFTTSDYSRVLAFRFDLRIPCQNDLSPCVYTNKVISLFFERFKWIIKADRARARSNNPYAHDSKVRYFWVREEGYLGKPHYHLLILLNKDAYYTVGRLDSDRVNMIRRLEHAWAGALSLSVEQVSGLVEIPDNAQYRIDLNDPSGVNVLADLFCRASYLCKAATKTYGSNQHGFGSSRG